MESYFLISRLQNAARIVRALFEMALGKGWPLMAARLLNLSKTLEKRLWDFENPLRQFPTLSHEILYKLEARRLSVSQLREMDSKEIGKKSPHHPIVFSLTFLGRAPRSGDGLMALCTRRRCCRRAGPTPHHYPPPIGLTPPAWLTSPPARLTPLSCDVIT